MKFDDEMRISYHEDKHIINLPKEFEDLKKLCFEAFQIEDEEKRKKIYFFAKIAGNPDICLQNLNYLIKENEQTFVYEIELKDYFPKDKSIKNPEDYLLEKKENENENIRVLKERKQIPFYFTLINKGNYTWEPPFRISNEKFDSKVDNKSNLTCSTYIVYQPVHPNDEIKCKVNISELDKKNRDSTLKIRLFKSDNNPKAKYPENSVEYKFTILPADEYYKS